MKNFKIALCLVLIIFFIENGFSQVPRWKWALRGGGTGWDHGYALTTDREGSVIVRGKFSDSGYFGDTVIYAGTSESDYLSKYDSSGQLIWALKLDTKADWERDRSLATDGNGNIYLTGYFEQSLQFYGHSITSHGDRDIFLACFNPSGQVLWVKSGGGKLADEGYTVAADEDNFIYMSGYFRDTASFDSLSVFSAGEKDVFIAKYDPFGRLIWLKQAGGSGNDFANSLLSDKNGHIYAFGSFSGLALFDTFHVDASPGSAMFLARFDSSGKIDRIIGEGGTVNAEPKSLAFAGQAVYITGKFSGTATFGGSLSLSATGQSDVYVAKYDSVLNYKWAFKAGTTGADEGNSIAASANGVYIAGTFDQTISFGTKSATAQGMRDAFFVCLDGNGSAAWLKTPQMGSGTTMAMANSIALAPHGSVYSCGEYSGSGSFGGFNPISKGSFDMFLCRFLDPGLISGTDPETGNKNLRIYPTVTSDRITVSVGCANDICRTVEIYSISGEKIFKGNFPGKSAFTEIDVSGFQPGIYLVILKGTQNQPGRFIKF